MLWHQAVSLGNNLPATSAFAAIKSRRRAIEKGAVLGAWLYLS
jgi:hypothetical protein